MILFPLLSFSQDEQEISKLYLSKDYRKLDSICTIVLNKAPDNVVFQLTYGRSLADQGKPVDAIPHLSKALQLANRKSWPSSWAYSYLGVCSFLLDKNTDAKAYFDSCIVLNATKNSVDFARSQTVLYGLSDVFDSWIVKETENIRFRFQDTVVIRNIGSFMAAREDVFKKISQEFNGSLPKKVEFFVWVNRTDATKILNRPVGFSIPYAGITHSHYSQTEGHELTHIIIEHAIKPKKKTRLVNEGVAVAHDQTNRDWKIEARKALRASDQNEVNIVDLWKNGKGDESLFYPLAGAWMIFLHKEIESKKYHEILYDQSYENAQKVLGKELKKIIRNFEKEIANE